MAYVELTKQDFIAWADKHLQTYKQMLPREGKELVLQYTLKSGLEAHIYTTVEGEKTRGIGEDAIRIILYDPCCNKVVGVEKSVHRSEGKTTPFDRMQQRMVELIELAGSQQFCKKCGSHLVEKKNKTNGNSFLGCSGWPACPSKTTKPHALRDPSSSLKPRTFEESRSVEVQQTLPLKVFKETDLIPEDELVPTECYPYQSYGFSHFNRVQSTIIDRIGWDADVNLVLGCATSTGKTISAEIFIGDALHQGKSVLYMSPLKSLTQEKFDDWSLVFPNHKIFILTGDYVLTPEREEELNEADILCVTSEMLDVRTRKSDSEKSSWLKRVGLLVVDESHIISMPERGHATEAGIIRFASVCPKARLLLLSATMPNVEDFEEWLTNLNGKKTEVINSSWRPTVLNWHFIAHPAGVYNDERNYKMQLACKLVQEKQEEKYLVFVHDKNTGRLLIQMMANSGVEAKFLNADLALDERRETEQGFAKRDGGDRVMVTTSVVAWGRNLPARNVVIVGTTRGINDVDVLDIIQMSGRAGRSLPSPYTVELGSTMGLTNHDKLCLRVHLKEVEVEDGMEIVDLRGT